MPLTLGICLLAVPVATLMSAIVVLRQSSRRSPGTRTSGPMRPLFAAITSFALGTVLFLAGDHDRAAGLYLALIVLSLVGAVIVQAALTAGLRDITSKYLDPSDWADAHHRGPRWRFEMRHRYVSNPEYVDAVTFALIDSYPSFDQFAEAIRRDELPASYDHVMDRRLWGLALPTTRDLLRHVVLEEVFANTGPYTSGKNAETIYDELRSLGQVDRVLMMDRWQFYWCLRNLNFLTRLLHRFLGTWWQLSLTLLAGIAFGATVALTDAASLSVELTLRALAAGALAWLVFVCAGASVLLVSIFRGTGTFTIRVPSQSHFYDPIWTNFIELGILAFTVSFLVYGIGTPFLLVPGVLRHFELGTHFLIYSGLTFALSLLIFLNHLFGTHTLMLGSRSNALQRLQIELDGDLAPERRASVVDAYKDIRDLRVWPVRASTLAQLVAGLGFPIAVQVVILYAGLTNT